MRALAGPARGPEQAESQVPQRSGILPGLEVVGAPATKTGTQRPALQGERPSFKSWHTGPCSRGREGQKRAAQGRSSGERPQIQASPVCPPEDGRSDFQFLGFRCWEAGLGDVSCGLGKERGRGQGFMLILPDTARQT